MRQMDAYAINTLGIPSCQLMLTAAAHTARAALAFVGHRRCAAVFCGSGNNGGDGVAAAEFLIRRGISTRVFLTGNRERMTADTAEMERRLKSVGGVIEDFDEANGEIAEFVNSCGARRLPPLR